MERILHRTSVGVTAKACRINGLNLTDVTYPPDLRQARHTHRFASFSLVKSGNYLETFNRQSFARRASTVVFHPPEESHAVNFETNVQILSVQFDFRRLAAIREHCAIFDEPASFRNENINHLGRRIYRELQRPDAFSSLAIEGLILEILAEASRCKTHGEEK